MPNVKLTGVRQRAAAGPEWDDAWATNAVARRLTAGLGHTAWEQLALGS
jgi:hypothetical protein